MTTKYPVETSWQALLKDMGISTQDVLRYARLPLDLFTRKAPMVTGDEFFRLWDALAYLLRDDPIFPLRLAKAINVEIFSPPVFACFCSPNLNIALKRLSHYKPIVGPLRLMVTQTEHHTEAIIGGLPTGEVLAPSLVMMELAFLLHMARTATREHIIPKAVNVTIHIPAQDQYEAYLGVPIHRAEVNGLAFRTEDAQRPFLTANETIWSIFEPNLNLWMQDLNADASFRDKVRGCLMEMIAGGQYSMADVASRLAMSPRTLQRRLRDENTTFQRELDTLREELARNYLTKSDYTSGQIAFLLGYEDPNSFFRAFRSWTGQTPEHIRAEAMM